MKFAPTLLFGSLRKHTGQRNLRALGEFLLALAGLIFIFSVLFHFLMAWEGREYSWLTGVYWTLTVMTTLGFGDITFESDAGRFFSIFVLLSGTLFMLILLPFTFIQFFYAPWVEAQTEALAPRRVSDELSGHVLLTRYGPVEAALIRKLTQYRYPYVVLVPDVTEALRLNELNVNVVVGALDDPATYDNVRLKHAALLATTHSDIVNTNVVFTVQEISDAIRIVATAQDAASVDILQMAGCDRVLRLAETMGHGLARRVTGSDAQAHVIGNFSGLLIAEASAAGTPMVNRTLREIGLREHANINVVGIWERGAFQSAGPDTRILASTILVLAGNRDQLDEYNGLFCIYNSTEEPVVVLGGGRVGRATARSLAEQGADFRIVERLPERVADKTRLVPGDAANLEVLREAGLMKSPAVVVTTHDDDMNIYLTLYCRRLRPDIQIISRCTLERNVNTLHRAGADFVLSMASMGANAIFNLLRRTDVLLLAEGLDVFKVDVPPMLAGKTLAESGIRETTKCHVIAIDTKSGLQANPSPQSTLSLGAKLVLIGSAEAEEEFLSRFVNS